ncbi:phosphotransferase [Shewanella colwelliana]|uniref:aminoglycoside phosphotransferase family protein n=1 Tax=Shewanella colwelliana TaxID=23 RepID=UPI00299D774D|nr:phosphotransferase [Shewanella colwelliana]MDX1279772.1 phosphotransferase [Shewanella colwelliana]
MPLSDPRFIALCDWIARTLGDDAKVMLISGDASFRRYFRVFHRQASFIAMDSPPEMVPVQPFIALANEYQRQGLSAPLVIAEDIESGFLLLSDLGDLQLLSVLDEANVSAYYQQALYLLDKVVAITAAGGESLPIYNDEFVLRELRIFCEWLVEHHLKIVIDRPTKALLDETFSLLVANVAEQPKAGMHRDYHSRNLMLVEENLAVIDFQDAVIGPITYDAVSLLRDCYVRWPDAIVDPLRMQHYQQLLSLGLISKEVSFQQYCRWFDLMGIQRHLKAAGIFCRLNYRDGKLGYMQDIPLTLEYVVDIGKHYPELDSFTQWITDTILPRMSLQS